MLDATWFVLAGMGIVFATLTVLALAMVALTRWFGPEGKRPAKGRERD